VAESEFLCTLKVASTQREALIAFRFCSLNERPVRDFKITTIPCIKLGRKNKNRFRFPISSIFVSCFVTCGLTGLSLFGVDQG
jgi:hypothetical protein